ncbi:MAG: DUF4129 domain-containing protein [Planctomycetota bacterium]|nr:DUF4129 domain-containing protein [Planctomycetota bacterium]
MTGGGGAPLRGVCVLFAATVCFASATASAADPSNEAFGRALDALERAPAGRSIVELRKDLVDTLQDGGLPIHEARGAVPPPRLPKLDEKLPIEARQARWRRLARDRIEGFRDAAARSTTLPDGAATARDRVLEDPIFAIDTEEASFWERIRQRIFRFLGPKLLGVASWVGRHGTAVAIGIVALAILLAVWLLVRTIRRDRAAPSAFDDDRLVVEHEASTEYWLERADAAFRAGRLVEALRAWIAASRAHLIDRNLLPLRRGLTERECVAVLRRTGEGGVGDAFRELAELHERVVYAGADADRELGLRARRAVAVIVRTEPAS